MPGESEAGLLRVDVREANNFAQAPNTGGVESELMRVQLNGCVEVKLSTALIATAQAQQVSYSSPGPQREARGPQASPIPSPSVST